MVSERMKFSKRLNDVLDEAGFPAEGEGRQSAIANLLDESPENVGLWLEGLDYPQTSKLVKLAKLVHVRSNWLMSGTGEKHADEAAEREFREKLRQRHAEKKRKAQEFTVHGFSKEALDFARTYMQMSVSQQNEIKKLMSQLKNH